MKCEGCGATDAMGVRIGYDANGKWEICDRCTDIKFSAMPDVYLGSKGGIQTDPNICDKQGREIPFSSKREKKAAMNEAGVRQAASAEHNHGARNITKRTKFI